MNEKSNQEVLAEIYRNAQLALTSIADILPEVDDTEVKKELAAQHEGYEEISGKAAALARRFDSEIKEPGVIKKAMMWSGIKMNTMTDNSRSHIAEMMAQGTVMGITALKASQTDSETTISPEVDELLKEMIRMEEKYERNWKSLL